jgi:hypothetical protein
MERAATFSTISASLVTIFAFCFGIWQFTETQKLTQENLRLQAETLDHERDSKAIELFLKFNELQREVANKPLPKRGDSYFWHHNMLLTITESVYRLTSPDPGWQETVFWMLKEQKRYIEAVPQGCQTFNTDFIKLMKKIAPHLNCT